MSKVTGQVWEMAEPIAGELGAEIWDVEYLKEAGQWFLRVYLDRRDRAVTIEDCETFSRRLDLLLDERDPIPTSYVFEVSSAGAERELRRASDYERFMGETVSVKLYSPVDGRKEYIGELRGYEDGDISIEIAGVDSPMRFQKSQVAKCNLHVVF